MLDDAFQQFFPVAAAAQVFQALIVHGEALDQVLAQAFGGPDAELRALAGLDLVADGDDDVQVEVLDLIGFAVGGSCCKFCNN